MASWTNFAGHIQRTCSLEQVLTNCPLYFLFDFFFYSLTPSTQTPNTPPTPLFFFFFFFVVAGNDLPCQFLHFRTMIQYNYLFFLLKLCSSMIADSHNRNLTFRYVKERFLSSKVSYCCLFCFGFSLSKTAFQAKLRYKIMYSRPFMMFIPKYICYLVVFDFSALVT